MNFLIIFGITEISCSFRLVSEGKTGKEIPESSRLEFFKKFLAKDFFIRCKREHFHWTELNRVSITDLPLLRRLLAIFQELRDPSFWEVMESFILLAHASLASPKTLFVTSLSELYLRSRRFILFIHTKKERFLWTMAGAQAVENQGDEWGLTWYLRWLIYASIPTWTHSQYSLAAAEALSLKISTMEHH